MIDRVLTKSPEQMKNAEQVLQHLADGSHPDTQQELPKIFTNSPSIIRALHIGIEALQSLQKRIQRRSQLPTSAGARWTVPEEKALESAFRSGTSVENIAQKHQRSVNAIESKLESLKLLAPEKRTTRTPFIHARTNKSKVSPTPGR